MLLLFSFYLFFVPARGQFFDDFENGVIGNCPFGSCGIWIDESGCLPEWAISHGTPHLTDDQGNQQLNLNFTNAIGEGAFRTTTIIPGATYELSFSYRSAQGTGLDGSHDPVNLNVELNAGLVHNPTTPVCESGIQNPFTTVNIANVFIPNVTPNWTPFTTCFTGPSSVNQLRFFPFPTQQTGDDGVVVIDNVRLQICEEPTFTFIPTIEPETICTNDVFQLTYEICLVQDDCQDDGQTVNWSLLLPAGITLTSGNSSGQIPLDKGECLDLIFDLQAGAIPLPPNSFIFINANLDWACDNNLNLQDNIAIEVNEGDAPTADFSAEDIGFFCGEYKYCFTSLATGDIDLYHWDFGDGNTSNEMNPCHAYTSSGNYTVTYTVSNICGIDSHQEIIEISAGNIVYDYEIGEMSSSGISSLQQAINMNLMPSGGVQNETVLIEGLLEIDLDTDVNPNPSYYFEGASITLKEGAEVSVLKDRTLKIITSDLKGCDSRWKSITIDGSAILVVESNSTIEDGQYAIHAKAKSIVQVENTTFNKNYIGILHDDLETFFPGPFFGNTFTCTETLLPHFDAADPEDGPWSFAGMKIFNLANLALGVPGAAPNRFDNIRNGVLLERTSTNILNTTFHNIEDMDEYGAIEGYAVHATSHTGAHIFQQTGFGMTGALSFENCTHAIFIDRMDVPTLTANNMNNVENGIRIENARQNVAIEFNNILANKRGIEMYQINPNTELYVAGNDIRIANQFGGGIIFDQGGLAPAEGFTYQIHDNDIFLENNFSTGIRLTSNNQTLLTVNDVIMEEDALYSTGIALKGSHNGLLQCNTATKQGAQSGSGIYSWDTENTEWRCNDITGLRTGMYVNMGGFSPDEFIGTDFSSNDVGLHIHKGILQSGSYMSPGALGPQSHTNCQWTGSFTNGAKHESDEIDIVELSQFLVHSSTSPIYPPNVSVIPPVVQNNFFEAQTGTPDQTCQIPNFCPINEIVTEVPEVKTFDEDIAAGQYETVQFSPETQWLINRYLYRKLDKNPELVLPGTNVETFYNEKATEVLGQIHIVEKGIQELWQIDVATALQISGNYEQMQVKQKEISGIDSVLVSASGNDSLVLLQQRATVNQDLENLALSQIALLNTVQTQRNTNASISLSDNNAVTTSYLFEQNEQIVNEIFLNTIALGSSDFDAAQFNTLRAIANQCPLLGGSAVFRARALLALVGDFEYDDESICQSAENREYTLQKKNESAAFTLYPNPSKGMVFGKLEQALEENANIIVYDYLGREVLRLILPAGGLAFEWNAKDFLQGLYIVKIELNDTILFSEKIIINK